MQRHVSCLNKTSILIPCQTQMQEEEELLIYHQYHRRLYKNGFSGFGEKQRGSKFIPAALGLVSN